MAANTVAIEVETMDSGVDFDLMGNAVELAVGDAYKLPDGSQLVWQRGHRPKSDGQPKLLELTLTPGSSADAGVIANYLFSKLNERAIELRIDGATVRIDRQTISSALASKIGKTESAGA
jgi:hypothetical protein